MNRSLNFDKSEGVEEHLLDQFKPFVGPMSSPRDILVPSAQGACSSPSKTGGDLPLPQKGEDIFFPSSDDPSLRQRDLPSPKAREVCSSPSETGGDHPSAIQSVILCAVAVASVAAAVCLGYISIVMKPVTNSNYYFLGGAGASFVVSFAAMVKLIYLLKRRTPPFSAPEEQSLNSAGGNRSYGTVDRARYNAILDASG
jgi:hypothetical protein